MGFFLAGIFFSRVHLMKYICCGLSPILMRSLSRFCISLTLIAAFLSSALPCGPGYITPLFDTHSAPDNPYMDYAAGRLGIIKPTFHRSVLFGAYRYIAGSGLSANEQKAIVQVWNAEINNKDFLDNSVETAVKAWVAKRKEVVGDEENVPSIYTERPYGGYDFFPNCSKNAFETAAETLAERITSHGKDNINVKDWVKAQDQVFGNCSSGKQAPSPAPIGAPDWLQKDRAYQIAAAAFYSMDYADAKQRFTDIALDTESPWQETADYLVARTLIRQASLSQSAEKAAAIYDEAEERLRRFVSRSGKFTDSAEGLTALIKYRRHPKERVSELAQNLSFVGNNDRFRQDLIDYNWLLDKFEAEALSNEEKRKAAEREKAEKAANINNIRAAANYANMSASANNANVGAVITNTAYASNYGRPGQIMIHLWNNDYSKSWTFYVPEDATDELALEMAEEAVGSPLVGEMKERVREARRAGYANRFSERQQTSYEGGYYGEEKLSPTLLPAFLKKDELTQWLFVYQMKGSEAYLYALDRYRNTASELWLMTALSKADTSSTQLDRLLDAASNSSRTSAAYTTIAYHTARILLAQGKTKDARKLIDEMLERGDDLPISAQNSFLELRLTLAQDLDDYLRSSLRRPFAFDFDGSVGTIDEFIEQQKSWFDPETDKEDREAYEAAVEERFRKDKLWQGRSMFDSATIEVFNQHFSTAGLIEVMNSPVLPEYLRERFAIAVWARAFLLNDMPTMLKIGPEIAALYPEMAPMLEKIRTAKTRDQKEKASLYFLIKNPLFSPYLEDGLGKSDNEFNEWDSNDWWCEPYDMIWDDETKGEVPKPPPSRPKFLNAAQIAAARAERKRLKDIGNAPQYLAEKVLEWARHNPSDKRLPESIYIMIGANGWTKYGCGNNEELRGELSELLRKRYPKSEWTAKLAADQN